MTSETCEDESFSNIVYTGKELADREFYRCSFAGCDFSNAILTGGKFLDCSFTNCNLSMTKLAQCQMNGVDFKGCKLLGVNFSECVSLLFAVKFEDCMLDYASFARKKMAKTLFVNSSLRNVDFSETDLSKAKFDRVNMAGAVFYHTTLKEADFLTAVNYSIDPEMNTLRKAKFSLQEVAGLLRKYEIVIE